MVRTFRGLSIRETDSLPPPARLHSDGRLAQIRSIEENTAQPQRKRRRIPTLSCHASERLTSNDLSEGGTAGDTIQATYPQRHPKACRSQRALTRKPGVSGTKSMEDEDALLISLKEVDCLP